MTWRIAPITAIALLVIGCINIILITAITAQLLLGYETATDRSAWDARLSPIAGTTGRRPLESYAQILSYPVFFKSREPFVAPPPVSPPPPSKTLASAAMIDPGLVVGGVMIKAGLSRAFLFSRGGVTGTWVSEGEVFQGWQVKSIDEAGVKLEQGGRPLELNLYPK